MSDWLEVVFQERWQVSRQVVSGHGGGFNEGTVAGRLREATRYSDRISEGTSLE